MCPCTIQDTNALVYSCQAIKNEAGGGRQLTLSIVSQKYDIILKARHKTTGPLTYCQPARLLYSGGGEASCIYCCLNAKIFLQ